MLLSLGEVSTIGWGGEASLCCSNLGLVRVRAECSFQDGRGAEFYGLCVSEYPLQDPEVLAET